MQWFSALFFVLTNIISVLYVSACSTTFTIFRFTFVLFLPMFLQLARYKAACNSVHAEILAAAIFGRVSALVT